MRFVVLVEGKTEEDNLAEFFRRWINPRLDHPVEIEIDRFEGNKHFYNEATKKARAYLAGPDSDEIIGVIGLVDLYVGNLRHDDGNPFYPPEKIAVQDRYEWAIGFFQIQANHGKFRMFMAVHEVEAWLISQPEIFAPGVCEVLKKEQREPEEINFDKPPSKFLHKVYCDQLNKGYKKTVEGINLFPKLDPTVAYQKCPYLKRMLDGMLELARGAGL